MTITLNDIIQDNLNSPSYKNGLYFDAITLSNHLKDEYFRKPMREDDIPISIGTEFFANNENRFVDNIVYYKNDFTLVDTKGYCFNYIKGERPKAPRRIKDCNGINIKVGDTVYDGLIEYIVTKFHSNEEEVWVKNKQGNVYIVPASRLSHKPHAEFASAADVVNYVFDTQVDEHNVDEYVYRLAEIVRDIEE